MYDEYISQFNKMKDIIYWTHIGISGFNLKCRSMFLPGIFQCATTVVLFKAFPLCLEC